MSVSPILVIFLYVELIEVLQFSLAAVHVPNMLLEVRTSCPYVEFPIPISVTIGGDIMYANPCQALITLFTPVVTSSVSPILLYVVTCSVKECLPVTLCNHGNLQ